MKSIIVTLLLITVVSAFSPKEYEDAFVSWMQQYQKSYTSSEFGSRFNAFMDNMDFVREWNSNPVAHRVELNQFADITNEEYQQIYLGTHITVPQSAFETFDGVLPQATVVDWRTKGYVTAVKDQGQCGSCWSFSATGSTEGAHFKATNNLVGLSEQNLMDCSTSYGNQGCNGGLMDSAFKYIIANKGLDSESSYPYTAKDGPSCRYAPANNAATLKDFKDVAKGSEDALLTAVHDIGPVSVAIDASKNSFQLYKSGVYYEPSCSSSRLDHGVLAIGYGTDDSNNADYWLVKNSWGVNWGQQGYIWMARNRNNNCGIATAASYPLA